MIRRLSRKKQRLYNRAKLSGLPEDWTQYHAAKKLMQQQCRQAHTKSLSDIFNCTSSRSHKNLWSYVKSKRRDQVSIPSLDANGTTVSGVQEKADLINHQQFTSVFTYENTSTLSDLGASPFTTILEDNISVDGVEKLFSWPTSS